jgi:Uma2 family endonuclease
MAGDAARALDEPFPGLERDIVEGYRHAPETMVAEILAGALSLLPRPRLRHARSATRLGGRLSAFDDPGPEDPGGWVILAEPELHLGPLPDVLVPDLAGWRRTRVPEDFIDRAAATIAPDWVCEVLSPSTEAIDRAEKMPIYARERVSHAWLLDPELRTLEVFRLERAQWVMAAVFRGDIAVRAEPFDAVELALDALWQR